MAKKKKNLPPPPQLPCSGVETHAHLDFPQFADDFDAVIQRAKTNGVKRLIQVFLDPAKYLQAKERFSPYSEIFYLLGIHPTNASAFSNTLASSMHELLTKEPRFRGLGEIGLDYYWQDQPRPLQRKVFAAQLELARSLDLPVVVHSRDAHEETIEILLAQGFSGRPLLWHCFGGNSTLAARLLDQGWHISIPGTITYPANHALREAVASIPADRLMTETDAPYLSPVPYRGQRNEPAYLAYTIKTMAEVKMMDISELWTICGDNASRFFSLP